jgi:hypothetical protein
MPDIKFTHLYKKLLDDQGRPVKTAKLLLVTVISLEELTAAQDFYKYDTDNGTYKIPYSDHYLVLLFQKPDGELFTTVRNRYNHKVYKHLPATKDNYYKNLVGKEFNVVVEPMLSKKEVRYA